MKDKLEPVEIHPGPETCPHCDFRAEWPEEIANHIRQTHFSTVEHEHVPPPKWPR